jgi:hypothetical protein
VGIGTSLPAANLHVVGYQYVNDPPTIANSFDHSDAPLTLTHGTPTSTTAIDDPKALLHLTRDGTTDESYGARASFNLSRYENSGTASRSRLDVALADGTYSESNVMSLRGDGKVGVGTTNPGYTLDVAGDINLSGSFYQGGAPFVSSEWTTGADSLYYRSNVEVGTGNLFVDTTTSNVGIGTTIPTSKLDVVGAVRQRNVPAFSVQLTDGSISGASDIDYNNVLYDNTNSYTSSNGRFTAPIAGYYFFSAHGIASGDRTQYDLTINGTRQQINSLCDSASGLFSQCNISAVLYLTAGQYVTVYQAEGATYGESSASNHNLFSGFFIG